MLYKIEDLVAKFGGVTNTAHKFGVTHPAVCKWQRERKIPYQAQCMIQVETRGRFKADIADKERRTRVCK